MTDKLTDLLTEQLPEADSTQVAALATALREQFDIRDKAPAQEPESPKVQRGQTWRNRKTDRLVNITAVPGDTIRHPETGEIGVTRQVRWEALTGRGPSIGRVYPHNWPRQFAYVEG